jgi:hypothetical protein
MYEDAELNLTVAEIDWETAANSAELVAHLEQTEQIFRTEKGRWGQLVLEDAPNAAATSLEKLRAEDA